MFKLLVLVAALAAVSSAASISREMPRTHPLRPTGRVVGGKDVAIEEVPYQVSIWIDTFHYCGGTMISEYWVATAAHCVEFPEERYSIHAGVTSQSKGGSVHRVAEIISHEEYHMTPLGISYNDIALVRVVEPFKLDETRQPIEISEVSAEFIVGAMGTITGWGETGLVIAPDVLQLVQVPIVSKSYCNEAYEDFGGLPENEICAAYPEGGKDACSGDSGGPLVVNGRLTGITSWGNGCGLRGFPGVYTEVSAHRAWIKGHCGA